MYFGILGDFFYVLQCKVEEHWIKFSEKNEIDGGLIIRSGVGQRWDGSQNRLELSPCSEDEGEELDKLFCHGENVAEGFWWA